MEQDQAVCGTWICGIKAPDFYEASQVINGGVPAIKKMYLVMRLDYRQVSAIGVAAFLEHTVEIELIWN